MPYCADLFYRYYDGGASSYVYPTLLIHGLGGSSLSWPHSLRKIPKQRVIAIDLPGHGLSLSAAYCSAKQLAHQLKEFIFEMGIFHFALVGHSMGSAVAYELAYLLPRQILALELISFGREFKYTKILRSYCTNENTKEKAIDFLGQKGFDIEFPKIMRQKILAPLKKIRMSVLRADLDVCCTFLANHPGDKFDFPVQLISGRGDQLVKLIDVKILAHSLPNASLKIMNECGHMAIFEQTETVDEILQEFLSEYTAYESKLFFTNTP